MQAAPTTFDTLSISELTIADVLSALCMALDLTEGQPEGHCLRTCYIGSAIGDELGLVGVEAETVFNTCLLKDLGCSSNAARICQLYLTDDRAFKRNSKTMDQRSIRQVMSFVLKNTGADAGLVARVRAISNLMKNGEEIVTEIFETRCQQGAEIALQMGFSTAVADGITALDEHWDGQGKPYGVAGDAIPIQARIALAAQVMDVFAEANGPAAAMTELQARSGQWFDPDVVDAAFAAASRTGFWQGRMAPDLASRVFDQQPAQGMWLLDDQRLDEVVLGFARVIDAKSPFTHGHSTRVALYTDMITERMGYSHEARRWMWRTALLHDIGKLGVSNQILDKPGKLTDAEFAQVKRHPQMGELILSRIAPFSKMAQIVAAHHERIDGAGYPYGLFGDQLTQDMRILTVADIFDALSADRPYRAAMPLSQVWDVFNDLAGAAVDPAILGVLKAAVTETTELGLL